MEKKECSKNYFELIQEAQYEERKEINRKGNGQDKDNLNKKYIEYNSSILLEFATELYNQAGNMIIFYTFLGIAIGVIISILITIFFKNEFAILISIPSGVIGLGVGYSIGYQKSLGLKAYAQLILCQRQIEKNIRNK
jgi:VIT1/CCC1 family predicted Fe2+/Mn2+ transporter